MTRHTSQTLHFAAGPSFVAPPMTLDAFPPEPGIVPVPSTSDQGP